MYTMNQITIVGFTGSDAEVHYTQSGTIVVTLSVATKDSWKDTDGDWQSRTDWHSIVSFGKLADFTRTLVKGSYVMVQGAVRTREYELDGVRQRLVEVRAESVGKLDRAERRSDAEGQASPKRMLDPDPGPVFNRRPLFSVWLASLLMLSTRSDGQSPSVPRLRCIT